MALSEASGDPLALSSGGHHPLTANGTAPSNTSTPVRNIQDPLAVVSSSDCLTADGDEDVPVKDAASVVQHNQQRSHVVQRENGQSQNGVVVKQNGSLRNLPPPSVPSSPITDSQRLAKCHVLSTLSPSSSSPPLQPPLCCQHCHFHATLCCPCGKQECPLFQNPSTGQGTSSAPNPGTNSSCSCCLSACTYSPPHPPHPSSSLCLHHHHHQHWQEHLQSHTHAPGIRRTHGARRSGGDSLLAGGGCTM